MLRLRILALRKWKLKNNNNNITFQDFHSFEHSQPPSSNSRDPAPSCWITLLYSVLLRNWRSPPILQYYLSNWASSASFWLSKKNCMSNERLLWGQEPLISQAFSCFPKDFTLSSLLFSIILKSFNFVLNQTLFVMLVDSSLRKLDHILDWCCVC